MRPALSVRLSLVVLASLSAGAVLTGCRSGSALHGRYNNFRAYYNTFYNAEQKLEEGETSLERSGTTVDRDRLLPLFPTTAATGGTGGPFQEAIDKSAQLLRERPGSKWADDALLVIGKAYFYQRNFVGAEQKFNETMAAADIAEDRRLRDEARFWLGRTYATSDRYDEGVAVLEEGLATTDGDRRWASRMRLALGELYARAGRWDEAAETLRAGAADEDDADLAARAYVLLGQVEEEAGRFEEAAEAYRLALRQKPVYELAFAAEVNRALVLGLDAGRPDDGLSIVRSMLRDDKHYERRGELALVEARLLASGDREAEAERRFREVLYDPELNGQSVRGRAHYYLGRFYDDVRGDLVRASAHFDSAATAYRSPALTDRPSRAAILGLDEQVASYGTLAAAARQIADTDSLLALGALSEEAFRERIAAIETERRRAFAQEQREMEAQRTAQAFAGGGGAGGDLDRSQRAPTPASQAVAESEGGGANEGGFLSYRDPSSVQAGYIAFQQQWGERPLLPNWRRLAEVQGGTATANQVGGVGEFGQNNPYALGQGPPPLDLSVVPRTPAKREELVTELASLRYELANAFFLSLGRADTAAALYRAILDETPSLPVATRARYALAEIELAAGRERVAVPLYEAVIAADPESDLARASRLRLQIEEAAPAADSTAQTSAAYDAARRRWNAGAPREAAAALVALADADPDAPSAPRAYLAAALAYIESVDADSVALLQPLPPELVSPVLVEAYEPIHEADAAAGPAPEEPGRRPPLARGREEVDDRSLRERELPDLVDDSVEAPETLGQAREERAEEEVVPEDLFVPVASDSSASESSTALRPPEPTPPLDSLQTDGLTIARPDSVPAAPPVGLDSTARVAADSAEADSAAIAGPVFTLRQHLAAVAARYPGTPYAQRAEGIAESLRRLSHPAADSAATAADSTAAGPVPTDSTGAVVPADSLAVPVPVAEERVPDEAPRDVSGLRGSEPIDPRLGGFAWRVQTLSIPNEARSPLLVLGEAGFRAVVVEAVEGAGYALLLGQFETEAEAEAARPALPAWARQRGEIVALDGYRLVGSGPGEGQED